MANIRSLGDINNGGRGGGFPGFPGGLPGGALEKEGNVIHISNSTDFHQHLNQAGNMLVVVDFSASWCGPCKHIAPYYAELSEKHTNVIFLKVDIDNARDLAGEMSIRGVPTFHFYKNKVKKAEFSGANLEQLCSTIESFSQSDATSSEGYRLGGEGSDSNTQSLLGRAINEAPVNANHEDPLDVQLREGLVEMGFSLDRANKAIKSLGSQKSIQGAIDWIISHPEDETDAVGVPAAILNMPAENNDTSIKKELTAEEIEQQQALIKAKLEEIRKKNSEDEKKREREQEIGRRISGKDALEAKRKWEEAQRVKDAEQKRRERDEDRRAKERIKNQLEQDKLNRIAAMNKNKPSAAPPAPISISSTKEYNEATIQFRFPDNSVAQHIFNPTDPIRSVFIEVEKHILEKFGKRAFSLATPYPRRTFQEPDLDRLTIKEAELVPRGQVIVNWS